MDKHIYLLTPWSRVLLEKSAGSLLVKEYPANLLNQKVHYHIHKCPPPVPILRHIDTVHAPASHFLKIHPNITLPSTPGSCEWSPSPRFPYQKYCIHLCCPPYVLYVPHVSCFLILSPEKYWVRSTDH